MKTAILILSATAGLTVPSCSFNEALQSERLQAAAMRVAWAATEAATIEALNELEAEIREPEGGGSK
jgi:hypothetical protein